MNYEFRNGLAVTIGVLLAVTAASAPARIQAQLKPKIYVTTTVDVAAHPDHCLPGNPCPIRGAIEKSESVPGGAVITACFDEAVVPDAKRCPGGKEPVLLDDANFDAGTGQWSIRLTHGSVPLQINTGGTEIDFASMLEPYEGPSDNRVVLDGSGAGMQMALQVESNDNVFRGFDIRGGFSEAAIVLQTDLSGEGASNNQLGPGLSFRDISEGNAVRIRGMTTVNNRLIGSWCGLGADGTTERPVTNDCVFLSGGTQGNVIGGEAPEDRNLFAASQLGVGVKMENVRTSGNIVRGNWFGLDVDGAKTSGLFTGILIVDGASENSILDNVIVGARAEGVSIGGETAKTLIEGNMIGIGPDGERCAGNQTYGIALQFGPHTSRIIRNHIACNQRGGVVMTGPGTVNNTLSENGITDNSGNAIDLAQRANNRITPPEISLLEHSRVSGRACAGCIVEAFTDPVGEAAHFEGRVTADAGDGRFELSVPGGFRFRALTLTQTEGMNTSALTTFRAVPPPGTPGPTEPTSTPPVGPSPTGGLIRGRIFLPWTADAAWLRPGG